MSSAAHSATAGSPASPVVYWANRALLELAVGDETHTLNPREAIILDILLDAKGRFIPRETFLNAIYDDCGLEEPDTSENILRIQMWRLRKNLGVEILSARGHGYCLGPRLQEWEPDAVYEGKGEVGRWRLSKRYLEPVLRFVNADDPLDDLYLPLSAVGLYGFQKVGGAAR